MRPIVSWEIDNGLVRVRLVGVTDLVWLSYVDFKDRYVEYGSEHKSVTELLTGCDRLCVGFLKDT